jgi:hypothetical protein
VYVSLYFYALTLARQRLGKHVPAGTNTQATIVELLDICPQKIVDEGRLNATQDTDMWWVGL